MAAKMTPHLIPLVPSFCLSHLLRLNFEPDIKNSQVKIKTTVKDIRTNWS